MPNQQVQLASFHLEGIALQWHRWLTKFHGPLTLEELTKAIQQRFGPTDYEDLSEALTHLKQNTTVAAYQEAFERLSYQVDGLLENFLIGCFIAGLRDEIRLDVKIKQPHTLADTIGEVRLIKERNQLHKRAPLPIRAGPIPVITKASLNPRLECWGRHKAKELIHLFTGLQIKRPEIVERRAYVTITIKILFQDIVANVHSCL